MQNMDFTTVELSVKIAGSDISWPVESRVCQGDEQVRVYTKQLVQWTCRPENGLPTPRETGLIYYVSRSTPRF